MSLVRAVCGCARQPSNIGVSHCSLSLTIASKGPEYTLHRSTSGVQNKVVRVHCGATCYVAGGASHCGTRGAEHGGVRRGPLHCGLGLRAAARIALHKRDRFQQILWIRSEASKWNHCGGQDYLAPAKDLDTGCGVYL